MGGLGSTTSRNEQVVSDLLEGRDVHVEDLGRDSRLLYCLTCGEGVDCSLLCPLPVVEELFEAVNLVDEFIVVASGEWGIWVSGVGNEVGRVNMVGEALGEELGQDGELVPSSLV